MPKKLKNHILNFIRFLVAYAAIVFLIGIWKGLVGSEHYTFIEGVFDVLYLGVAAWFGWRFYTGTYRDGDFFIDD